MSKKRKKKHTTASHEKEEHVSRKSTETTSNYQRFVVPLIVAIIFLGIGYYVGYYSSNHGTTVMSTAKGHDELIFISPPGCTTCDKFEPIAKDVANTLGIPFYKTGYSTRVSNPGYIIVYNGTAAVWGINDEATFKTQVCVITNNEEICNQAKQANAQKQQTQNANIPKKEKTNVKYFVMAYCPFGNQAESGLYPVYKLLKDKVDWEPHYVIYPSSMYSGREDQYCMGDYCSMHGIQELHEDVRELCIWKYESHDKFWDFIDDVNTACNAKNVDSCWEDVARRHGIDVDKVKQCFQNEAMDILKSEYQLNQQYGVRGSPTVFINDQMYSGSRSPEAYKNAICSGFNNPPEECNQTLSNDSSSSSGGCG